MLLHLAGGDRRTSREQNEQARALWQALGYTPGVALATLGLANVAYHLEDNATARTLFGEARALCEQAGLTRGIAVALTGLATIALNEGDPTSARHLHEQALALAQTLGDRADQSADRCTVIGQHPHHPDPSLHDLQQARRDAPQCRHPLCPRPSPRLSPLRPLDRRNKRAGSNRPGRQRVGHGPPGDGGVHFRRDDPVLSNGTTIPAIMK